MENDFVINTLVVMIVLMVLIITTVALILLWNLAEKSNNRIFRLVVLVPIYLGMLLRTVENLVESIEKHNYLYALFLVVIIVSMIIGFVLGALMEFNKEWLEKWLEKWVKKLFPQDKANK